MGCKNNNILIESEGHDFQIYAHAFCLIKITITIVYETKMLKLDDARLRHDMQFYG